MNSTQLKIDLKRKIDMLQKKQLDELEVIIEDLIQIKNKKNDWDTLSELEKNGILDAINDLKINGGIEQEKMIKNIRTKIINE